MVVEMPLDVVVVAGVVVALAAPGLAVLGVLAGLVAKIRIEVVRKVDDALGSGDREPGIASGLAGANREGSE